MGDILSALVHSMTLDIFNATMQASSGVFVVHEPHDGQGGTTVVKQLILPTLICSWWAEGKFPTNYMVGIVSQSFQ